MSKQSPSRRVTRRSFFKLGAGALAAAAGARFLPQLARPASRAFAQTGNVKQYHLAATDGWMTLPGSVPIPENPGQFYLPDPWAPPGRNCYIFGFRDVTGMSPEEVLAQKNKAQHTAPMLWMDQEDDVYVTLTNLGLTQRPDLTDPHSIHWHGFRNAIPYFDGVPQTGAVVPLGRDFTYYYKPRDPGTYMYHCHVEDVEHIHMGMVGPVFVRPIQNQAANATSLYPSGKFVYNDGDGSTGYDREFVLILSEVWAQMHWYNAHIQTTEWTDYRVDYYLMNGRVYPDTLAPHRNANFDPGPVDNEAAEPLQYQPMSSLITANAGERVLLRFINLGYVTQTMTIDGLKMQIVGKDATHLRGRDGTSLYYETNSVAVAPGESTDAIFIAPAAGTHPLYNRNFDHLSNPGGGPGYGGQMTEIRISPAGTLPAQQIPNV